MNKKVTLMAVPLIAATIIGFGAYGISTAYAAEDTNLPPFMSRLAERFGLNEGEVHEFMDEDRVEHKTQMEANFEQRMEEAVKNGDLTEDQVKAIETKHDELEAKREEVRNQEPGTRREAMHEIRDEMHDWIVEQGLEDVMPEPQEGMQRGGGNGHRF